MSSLPRALVLWSGGKDSAWALHQAREHGLAEAVLLLTTYSSGRLMVPLQEITLALIDSQAQALDLPLLAVPLPEPCPNTEYEARLLAALEAAKSQHGIEAVISGDLYLQDIRDYRDALLARAALPAIYPLWGRDTRALASEMLAGGLQAVLSCVETQRLPVEWLARPYDEALLADIDSRNLAGEKLDPCGERGEFHTLVTYAPGFDRCLGWQRGPQRLQGPFASAGLQPDWLRARL